LPSAGQKIGQEITPFARAVDQLDEIPGVGKLSSLLKID